jgi:hypothetical protein
MYHLQLGGRLNSEEDSTRSCNVFGATQIISPYIRPCVLSCLCCICMCGVTKNETPPYPDFPVKSPYDFRKDTAFLPRVSPYLPSTLCRRLRLGLEAIMSRDTVGTPKRLKRLKPRVLCLQFKAWGRTSPTPSDTITPSCLLLQTS